MRWRNGYSDRRPCSLNNSLINNPKSCNSYSFFSVFNSLFIFYFLNLHLSNICQIHIICLKEELNILIQYGSNHFSVLVCLSVFYPNVVFRGKKISLLFAVKPREICRKYALIQVCFIIYIERI